MWTRQHKQSWTGRLIVPAISAAVSVYFGYHAFQGEYGIRSTERYLAREAELQTQLRTLREGREALEHRVSMMQDGSLDRDLVDEQARRALNLSHADELTIIRPIAPGS
ncbi:MAG TPA: septum formation initiator family protein [Mesorhizobium sp.]|jgi:cell division protein FtsB|nr:septum formation initiator family protein [Mesorhizobium sp.]